MQDLTDDDVLGKSERYCEKCIPPCENVVGIQPPADDVPILQHRTQTELVLEWQPWTFQSTTANQSDDYVKVAYDLQWRDGNDDSSATGWKSWGNPSPSCTAVISQLRPGQTYSFRVRAQQVGSFKQ